MTDTILIIGIGNEFRRDDAAGLLVARHLVGKDLAGVGVMEQSGDGTELLETWKDAKKVIIIDAISSGAKPGTIYRIESDQLNSLGNLTTLSTHGFGLAEAVRFAQAMGQLPPELLIFGIEGQSFDHGMGLSPSVEKAVSKVVERITTEEIGMHEYDIARDIVRQALAEAELCGAERITTLHLEVGPEVVDREALSFGIQAAAHGTKAEGVAVEIVNQGRRGIVLGSMEVEEAN